MSELDLYFDGALSAAERAEFESRASRSLAREIALQREIDTALRRMFAPVLGAASARVSAAAIPVPARPDRSTGSVPITPARSSGPAARAWIPVLAAAALVVAIGAWAAWLFGSSRASVHLGAGSIARFDADAERWSRIYAEALTPSVDAVGCTTALPARPAPRAPAVPAAPSTACTVEWPRFQMAVSPSLELDPLAPRVRTVSAVSAQSASLFAFEGLVPPSVVWVELVERDPHPLARYGDLSLFRRVVGPFVLYELTRGDRPLALGYFRLRGAAGSTESTPR